MCYAAAARQMCYTGGYTDGGRENAEEAEFFPKLYNLNWGLVESASTGRWRVSKNHDQSACNARAIPHIVPA